jgi:hypothetical protein
MDAFFLEQLGIDQWRVDDMKKSLPLLIVNLAITFILLGASIAPAQAQPPGLSGDQNLAFLLEVNGVSAVDSDLTSTIPVNLTEDLVIELEIETNASLTIHSFNFQMIFLGISVIDETYTNSPPFGLPMPSGTTMSLLNASIPLGLLIPSVGGLDLFSGTITGVVTFVYELTSDPGTNQTTSDNFVLQIGPTGVAAVLSVTGLITLGFTVMSVFSLLMALDDFQQGILAARKMRKGKTPMDVGSFPRGVVIRRKPKKKGEKIDKDELIRRVGQYVPEDVAKKAPKALDAIPYKSKIPVGKICKRVKLKAEKCGQLVAALTEMKILQTKSVKVPLKKVAFSGITLSGMYWSWMTLLSAATPSPFQYLLTTTAGLVVSVIIGYFMNWLARVPKFGYE